MLVIARSVLLSLMAVAWLLRLSPLLSAETDDSLKRGLEELASLDDQHQKMLASWRAGLDAEANERTEALNDADFLARMRSNNPYPAEILGPKFVAFAERNPDERVALPALVYVVRHGASENDPESPLWKAREAAITLITERYKDSRSIQILLICVSRSMPSGPSERLLRTVFSQTPHREAKATAGYALACYLREKSRFLEEFRKAVADDENGEDELRFWRLVTVPYLERQRIGPPATLLAEVKLLNSFYWPFATSFVTAPSASGSS